MVSLGRGKACLRFWGRLDQNSGFHGNRKPPLTYNGENDVSTFSQLFLIRSFLYLQVTRTCIKSQTNSNFGQIGPLTTESAALERLKIFHRLIKGKCCLCASSFIFDRIIIKFSGNQDRHKSSDEFNFGPDHTAHFGVTCHWMTKLLHFRTWISLRPVGQSWSNFMCSITGDGERLHNVLSRLDQNSDVHGNRKPQLIYNVENGVSTFSWLLLIRSFSYLHVTRTCTKSRASSNFGQIGPLTTELAALERLKNPIDL